VLSNAHPETELARLVFSILGEWALFDSRTIALND
jgi:hypothetical protein